MSKASSTIKSVLPPRAPLLLAAFFAVTCPVLGATGKPEKPQQRQAASPPSPNLLEPRAPARPGDPREPRIARMREQVQDILRSPPLSRLRVGLEVLEPESGEVLLARNAGAPFNPASNTKILTTAAALSFLGSDFRYRTVLLAPAPAPPRTAALGGPVPAPAEQPAAGVLHGDVFLQGSGDPSLGSAGLAELARDIGRAGITRIEGDLLVDGQFRSLAELDRSGSAGAKGGGALIVNRNGYTVHVSPGKAGHPAGVWVEPRLPLFVLSASVKTVRGRKAARVLVDHSFRNGHLYISVRGRIGEQHADLRERRHLPDGGALAAAVLAQALSDFGITLTGQVRFAPPPPGPLRVIAEHKSPPLSEVCWLSNKDSNNFVADTIFKTLGGERFGLPGTLEKGARAVFDWLGRLGISPARVKIVNGSGLTHENRVSPDDLAHLLLRLYHDIQLFPEFLQSLAIGGIDGTIRSRFHGASVGLVRAKTGTLSGVSTLSGYVGDKQGVLVFSIMVEGFGQKRLDQVRQAQVLIVESLLRYLRGAAPPAPPLPGAPPPPATEDDEDAETDPA